MNYVLGKADEESEEITVLLPLQLSPQPVAETSDPLFQRLPVQILAFHPNTPFVFNFCHNPLFPMLVLALTCFWPGMIICGCSDPDSKKGYYFKTVKIKYWIDKNFSTK